MDRSKKTLHHQWVLLVGQYKSNFGVFFPSQLICLTKMFLVVPKHNLVLPPPPPPPPPPPHTLLFLMDQMHDRSPTTNSESKPHNKCVHSNKLKAFLSQILVEESQACTSSCWFKPLLKCMLGSLDFVVKITNLKL